MFDWLNNLWQQSSDTSSPIGLLSDEQLQQPWQQEQLPGYDAQGNWTGRTAGSEYSPSASIFTDDRGNSLISSQDNRSFWDRLKSGDPEARKMAAMGGAVAGGLLGYFGSGKPPQTTPAPAPQGSGWAPTWQAQGQFQGASPYTPDDIAKRMYRGGLLATRLRQQQAQSYDPALNARI